MSSSKSSSLPLRSLSGILMASLLAFTATSPLTLLHRLTGHITVDPSTLTHYANHSALHNTQCTVNTLADACEDIKIHFDSHTAFIACGYPEARTHWYPPSGAHDAASRPASTWQEGLWKYDIKSKRTVRLEIEGVDDSWDFITHGIDVLTLDKKTVRIFAVNHARGGDVISVFDHTLGTDSVRLVKDVKHPGIKNANGVAAVGPLEFFITNDHYFTSAAGPLRTFEEQYGPWTWATHVQFCDANGESTYCRIVSPSFPGANGIAISNSSLYVGDCKTGVARIFDIAEDKSLHNTATVELGGAADNINVIPTTGDLIVALFADLEALPTYLANVPELGKSLRVPSCAVRLVKARGFEPELIYWDDGGVVSYMTVAAVDPYLGVMINGAVLQYGGFAVCDVPGVF